METIESINWLKENNLYELAKNASVYLKKMFVPCLAVQNEKILIMGDRGFENKNISAILSGGYYLAAESLNLNAKLVLQTVKARGMRADDDVIGSLTELKENNIVFVNMSDKLGGINALGKSFRKMCQTKKHKFISSLSLGDLDNSKIKDIIEATDINYKTLQAKHDEVKKNLDNAEELHIQTKAGTDLYYNIKGKVSQSADGNYTEPGKGGNMPAGEVYVPPNGKRVNGTVIIDASSRNHTHTTIIKKPINLKIEEGSITEISGDEEAKELEKALNWAANRAKHPNRVRRIGEFGIGLNPNAKIIGSTVIDEKVLGTAHIGIGSNYWFGGDIFTIIHLDQIFKNPEIYVDNKLMKI